MKISNYINEVEKLIASGDTESACEGLLLLLEGKNDELRTQTLLLSGQFKDIKRKQSLGIDNDAQGLNRINHALLQMCREIKTELGASPIEEDSLRKLHAIVEEKSLGDTPTVSAPDFNWRRWLTIAAVGLVGLLFYRAYSCTSIFFAAAKEDRAATEKTMQKSDRSMGNASDSPTAIPEVKPIYLDVKANIQNFELLETRYFPTDGMSRIEFYGKFYCALGNPGGCEFSNNHFKLIADDKIQDTQYGDFRDNFNKYGQSNALPISNAHQFVYMQYEFPSTTKRLSWQINILGKSTIPIDLTKRIPEPPVQPKVINITEEKDLNLSKNFGNYRLLSVKVAPFDDDYVKITARISKCVADCDFYHECVRILTDNGTTRTGASYAGPKTISEGNGQQELQFEIIVPRTARAPELVVGNCGEGKTPFKVALPL
jgi:Effector-associated domain 11